ncbi:hypothetical protein [Chryseobacterium sp.]|uniref:hypothetical protein n=1 Tax=Chryseobacterium sp. TaxID=1871047 RepID=UPI002FC8A61A
MSKNQDSEDFFWVNKIKEIEICETKFLQFSGTSFRKPTDFIRERNEQHNLENCEGCKKNYLIVLERFENRHKNFPNCCKYHKKLSTQSWFNVNDYIQTPQFAAEKTFYSWHLIMMFIDDKDWDNKIFDYLHYIIYTFGTFPEDFGAPLFLSSFFDTLKQLLNSIKEKKYSKKKQAIEDYLDSFYLNNSKKTNTDFNVLIGIYNQWYKEFPFDVSIFQHLKEKFSKSLPIIEKVHYNKYLEVTVATPKTKHALINQLENITNKLLLEINALKLYEEGKLNDINNYKLEIILKKRKLKLNEGYKNDSKNNDTRYRKILKSWLADEIEFVKEISPTIKSIELKQRNMFLDILYSCNKLQENKIFSNLDENNRTKQILDILELNYHTKDQSQVGYSSTGKKAGSVDGIVIDENNIEHFIEALNLKSIDKKYIESHIHKLEKNYDNKGLPNKFLIIYCNVLENTFDSFYNKYFNFISDEFTFIYNKVNIDNIKSSYANQRIIKTTHTREEINVNIYHILLKM